MSRLKTGDLILFKGTSLTSRVICWASGSLSHVGTLVKEKDCSPAFSKRFKLKKGGLYLSESTSISKCKDVYGDSFSGVQLVPLEEKIDRYSGMMWHRGLDRKLSPTEQATLEKNIMRYYGAPYERSRVALAMAAFDYTRLELAEDKSSWFCSEWSSFHYASFKWHRSKINEFTPTDLGFKRIFDPELTNRSLGPTRKLAAVLL